MSEYLGCWQRGYLETREIGNIRYSIQYIAIAASTNSEFPKTQNAITQVQNEFINFKYVQR